MKLNASATELTKSKAANEVIKQDADSDIKQEPASNNDAKQDTGSNIEQEPASKADTKQITNDQPNTNQAPVTPATTKLNLNPPVKCHLKNRLMKNKKILKKP